MREKRTTIQRRKEQDKMKEYLYSIGMKDSRTGEKMCLRVWGKNVNDATAKITSALFGYHGEYVWSGSGPLYENNEIISRDAKD